MTVLRIDSATLEELPVRVRDEIESLQSDGYHPYKLWAIGVELRKGAPFGGLRLTAHLVLLLVVPAAPFVVRSFVRNLCGYRHRVFVALDESEPLIRFV
jgi:hypothetical protein